MRRPLAVAVAATVLAAGATTAAADELFAATPGQAEVRLAPQHLRGHDIAEHRAEFARDLARRLDVSVDAVEGALDTAHRQLERQLESHKSPDPGMFVRTLADELDKSESQVREALHEVVAQRLEEGLDAAVKSGRLSDEQADRIRRRFED